MFVEVSTNGGSTWSTLLTIDSADANPGGFVTESLSVTPSSQLRIRFRFDSGDGQFNNFEGWYIESVEIIATP